MMYSKCKASDIIIWCDGRETRPKRKKETEGTSTNHQEKEEEVDEVFKTLQQKHSPLQVLLRRQRRIHLLML